MKLLKKKPGEKIGETLIRLKIVNELQILKALEESTGIKGFLFKIKRLTKASCLI